MNTPSKIPKDLKVMLSISTAGCVLFVLRGLGLPTIQRAKLSRPAAGHEQSLSSSARSSRAFGRRVQAPAGGSVC